MFILYICIQLIIIKISLRMYNGLGLAQVKKSKVYSQDEGVVLDLGGFVSFRVQRWVSSMQIFFFRSILRVFFVETVFFQLWFVFRFCFVVRVVVQVFEQRFVIGGGIGWQQFSDLFCILLYVRKLGLVQQREYICLFFFFLMNEFKKFNFRE